MLKCAVRIYVSHLKPWKVGFIGAGYCSYGDIPKSVSALVDDPFRSLAGELRRVGGFAKDTTPFSEFLWADFLRRRIKRKLVQLDFDRALATAMKFAKSQEAIYLPGWCGATLQES